MNHEIELRLTIAKLVEIAYQENKGLTTKVMLGNDNYRLVVDQDGNAMLSSRVGSLRFNGSPALEQISTQVRNINVSFSRAENGKVNYHAVVSFYNIGSIGFRGNVDMEALITSCSGLLCQAARALKSHKQRTEEALNAFGH
ncbi:hypothetical protein SAMN04488051_103528 [Alkalimonas amylolytica]|uniref:Uncharacterized protein n=2 Tax=Alkalimonas amylolytica TaxID=152573 RepID=A0A1H4BUP2_ALKAM|nr:hypothetical protein SAMN04488051_103528 [Alkalimonas amylolytica]